MCLFKSLLLCVLLFSVVVTVTSADDEYKIVETRNGRIRGIRKSTLLKKISFYSFKGIPYAKPPLDDLRFKAPEPIESWTPTTLDAFEHGKTCFQSERFSARSSWPQSEDCLTLNVYVPANIKPNEKLPVLFWIHGGAFIGGSGNDGLHGPDFLIEKRTILVTSNYRLGVLGFLSLSLPEYSGNMGLKDIQLALKWTNKNIERFGGDRKRITISGHSAGGALTHFQVLSSQSRKYFRNAIIMSGSAENQWALSNDDHLKRAFNIAQELGKTITDHDDLVKFLQNVPAEKLYRFADLHAIKNVLFKIPIGPIVERDDAKQPFLREIPQKIYENANIDVDTMFTLASIEMLSLVPIPSSSALKEIDANFAIAVPFKDLHLPENSEVSKAIRKFYFGDGPIDEKALVSFYEYFSDLNFVNDLDRSVKRHVAHSKGTAHYAWFSIDSALNVMKKVLHRDDIYNAPGTAHGDELCYLFRCGIAQELYNQILDNKTDEHSIISHQAIEHITTLFANFVKYGKPIHEDNPIENFPSVQLNAINYLHIGNDGLKLDSQPRKEAIEFWNKLRQSSTKAHTKESEQKRDEL